MAIQTLLHLKVCLELMCFLMNIQPLLSITFICTYFIANFPRQIFLVQFGNTLLYLTHVLLDIEVPFIYYSLGSITYLIQQQVAFDMQEKGLMFFISFNKPPHVNPFSVLTTKPHALQLLFLVDKSYLSSISSILSSQCHLHGVCVVLWLPKPARKNTNVLGLNIYSY